MDVEFLDEVAAFLASETLPRVVTPCRSPCSTVTKFFGGTSPIASLEASTPPPVIADSSSEDVEPESLKSGSSDGEKVSPTVVRQDNRRKRYRERVKNEREELKRMETQLSTRVQELVDIKEGRKTDVRADLMASMAFWQNLARRQREQCDQSEAEHKQLVAAVRSQAVYIENLCAVLKVRPMDNHKWLLLKSSDATLYDLYLREVNEFYAMTDQVFEECGMEALPISTMSAYQHFSPNGKVAYTQYVNKLLQPFGFENTSKSMWEVAKFLHRDIDRKVYESVSDNGNTHAFKFRMKKILSTGSTVSILKRGLARRFRDANRTLIVFKIFSEGEGIFSGMDIDETGWICMRPYSDGLESGTLMEICLRQDPVSYVTARPNDSALKEFKDMLHDAVEEDNHKLIRSLEKLSLEDTLANIEVEP
ncbi:hypothetical protein PRIC1_012435 [Phytophthora ramorum]